MLSENVTSVLEHKRQVAAYLQIVIASLIQRAIIHDDSKFSPEELESFERVTPRLKTIPYGSEEYRASLKEIQPAIQHHYQINDHHPEHFEAGISSMNLIELLEMICDWMAATQRSPNGDIHRSLDINRSRFGIDSQLFHVLKNTVNTLAIEER
jgi:hypothetical protein